ncbi:MAG: phosphatase PAP2 family protein [Anaerolineales bacterium]|nr:phosphatase PAP2 family protein [Anaerolineales bacterium]
MNFAAWEEFDARWSARLRVAEKPGISRTLAMVFAHSGDSWFWLLGLGLLWAFGNPAYQDLTIRFIAAILVLAVLVMTIKFTIRRSRPEGDWGAVYRKTDPHSFPSGHAARAAMIAILALLWCPIAIGLALTLWALLVSLARIAMGVHYPSDVLAGAILGVIFGVVFSLITL